jgi:hypothetical protein
MTLDVLPPDPPSLSTNVDVSEYDDVETVGDGDYRRAELQAFLEDGAWERAFDEWAAHTDLDETEWGIVEDLGLVQEYDFFWDEFADRVGYHTPGIPEDWRARDLHPDLDSWNTVSMINAGLAELGRTASDLLKADYVDWNEAYEAPADLPDFD